MNCLKSFTNIHRDCRLRRCLRCRLERFSIREVEQRRSLDANSNSFAGANVRHSVELDSAARRGNPKEPHWKSE